MKAPTRMVCVRRPQLDPLHLLSLHLPPMSYLVPLAHLPISMLISIQEKTWVIRAHRVYAAILHCRLLTKSSFPHSLPALCPDRAGSALHPMTRAQVMAPLCRRPPDNRRKVQGVPTQERRGRREGSGGRIAVERKVGKMSLDPWLRCGVSESAMGWSIGQGGCQDNCSRTAVSGRMR